MRSSFTPSARPLAHRHRRSNGAICRFKVDDGIALPSNGTHAPSAEVAEVAATEASTPTPLWANWDHSRVTGYDPRATSPEAQRTAARSFKPPSWSNTQLHRITGHDPASSGKRPDDEPRFWYKGSAVVGYDPARPHLVPSPLPKQQPTSCKLQWAEGLLSRADDSEEGVAPLSSQRQQSSPSWSQLQGHVSSSMSERDVSTMSPALPALLSTWSAASQLLRDRGGYYYEPLTAEGGRPAASEEGAEGSAGAPASWTEGLLSRDSGSEDGAVLSEEDSQQQGREEAAATGNHCYDDADESISAGRKAMS